jgi:hypothetical protein
MENKILFYSSLFFFQFQFRLANDPNPFLTLSTLRVPAKFCPFKKAIACDPQYPYRQLDGSCNNLKHLWWGQAETPYKRYLPADYSDRNRLYL